MTLPLAVVGGFMPLAVNTFNVSSGGFPRMGWMVTQAMTGYDTDTNHWWMGNLSKGLFPIMGGFLIHKVASKFGINRALAAARVNFLCV
jgi:hypothetical protein